MISSLDSVLFQNAVQCVSKALSGQRRGAETSGAAASMLRSKQHQIFISIKVEKRSLTL